MGRAIRRAGLVSLVLLPAIPPPATAQDLTQGRATVASQTVTLGPAVALWDAEQHSVSMLFTTQPLPADREAAAREDGEWPIDGVGPAVRVSLSFAPGTFSGMVGDLTECLVEVEGFTDAPVEIAGSAADCHVVSTGGRLQPGGMLIGLLEGRGEGYAYRLPFSVMFPAAPAPGPADPSQATTAAPTPTAPPLPVGTVTGTGTFTGQTLRFTHGLAWVRGERLHVALFERAPRDGILAELRSGSWGEGGPAASLSFILDAGKSGPAAVTYCFVNLTFPTGGAMGLNVNDARGCGLTAIGGDLTPGGSIAARLAGSAPVRDEVPMAWDLQFNLPIAR